MAETSDRTRGKRRPRTITTVYMRVSGRTSRQWEECRAIATMLDMRADELLAVALNHAKLDLQRRLRKKCPSISWDEVYARARSKSGSKEPAKNPVNYADRAPRVDS